MSIYTTPLYATRFIGVGGHGVGVEQAAADGASAMWLLITRSLDNTTRLRLTEQHAHI